jgi:hypothetical protein
MSRPTIERVVQLAILTTWEGQIEDGYLTPAGLEAVRRRLLYGGEFGESTERDHMLILVGDALAAHRGIDPADIPGSPLAVPDSPDGIDGAPW